MYKPTWQLKSIYDLTPEMLKKHHIQVILTDLDNTLLPWDKKENTERLSSWIQTMKSAGIQIVIVSNNNEERVKQVADALDVAYISRARKPFASGILKALAMTHQTKDHAVMIGDQLLTDIHAASSAHVRSILVKPLAQNDAWNTSINRFLEKRLKKWMSAQMKWQWEETL